MADTIPGPPSTYWHRQIYGCFFRDKHGLDSLDVIGEDNVTFETDYPQTDSTWPHTKKVAEELMGHLPQPTVDKIVRGNAIKMLHLDLDE
ncbi:MAG: amidohydrolase family protein [Acidimicrobiales bacterium]|nr:amidohydrolase family protein [Acidimicrobiales bacterium]